MVISMVILFLANKKSAVAVRCSFCEKEGNYEKQTDECVLTYLIETIISKDPNTEKPPDVPTALLSAFSRSGRG